MLQRYKTSGYMLFAAPDNIEQHLYFLIPLFPFSTIGRRMAVTTAGKQLMDMFIGTALTPRLLF
jgi:hypothetical protein